MYATKCLKLLIEIENEFFNILYNTDVKINVIIKTAVNVVKLSIQSDSTISLMMYNSRNYSFIKTCLNVEVNCKEMKYYTSVFVIKKAVYNLLLEKSYQIVTQIKQIKMNDKIY